MTVRVVPNTYLPYDEDDFQAGGAVKVECDCGFRNFVECDDDGQNIRGECEEERVQHPKHDRLSFPLH